MTKRSHPVRILLPLASALLLLGGALVLRTWQARKAPPPLQAMLLRKELAALPQTEPAELVRWRARHAELAARRWTEPARAGLESRLGARWQWRLLPVEAGTRSYVLSAVTPEALAWPSIVAALTGVESAPGASVDRIVVSTAGSRTMRHFSRVEIHICFQWTESGTAHTVPPESVGRDRVPRPPGLPARGAKGRARPASLRRTSASAEPPAPARPPLRSRPDPSRRARSRTNLSEPQPT